MSELFPLGRVVATPGALAMLEAAGKSPQTFLNRHAVGDWGDMDQEDKLLNDEAVKAGDRIFSGYQVTAHDRLWIITEADRSSTCVLLPSEY